MIDELRRAAAYATIILLVSQRFDSDLQDGLITRYQFLKASFPIRS